jgi:YggT family protein
MFTQIFSFLFDVVFGLLAGACLLRLWMQWQRVGFANPLGRFVMALTDWIIVPLRRVLPAAGPIDSASLAAGLLLCAAHMALLALLFGGTGLAGWLLLTPFALARVALSGLMVLVIVAAVLSWTQITSPLAYVIDALVRPLLAPLRRVLPALGGIDVSPLVLLVLLQIAQIVLAHAQTAALRTLL